MSLNLTLPTLITNTNPRDNARIEINRDHNGAIRFCIRDGKHPQGYAASVSPEVGIQIALTILEKCGVPIQTELKRRLAEGGPLPGGAP